MTTLLSAKKVAGTSNLQIQGSHTEAASEIAELFDRSQTLASDLGKSILRRNQQISVGTSLGPTHSSPKLVQLGQTEPFGMVNDNRVHIWDIEPVFDNGGGK